MDINYSVIIRTIGKAGKKYQALLDSVDALEPKPREVIVVLPEGYELPQERLGYETFYYCPKGMIIQRMYGIEKCQTRYALICDDDVAFDPDFVQKLYRPISEGKCSLSAGPLLNFFPQKWNQITAAALIGSAVPTLFHRNMYVKNLRTGGWSYNRHIDTKQMRYYPTESVAWTCFFADIEALKKVDFNDERIWLEKYSYAYADDQTMFQKANLRNIKTIVVSTALYDHLDGRTAVAGINLKAAFASSFNKTVYWHRFIYEPQTTSFSKLLTFMCHAYSIFMSRLHGALKSVLTPENKNVLREQIKGRREGERYIKSQEYKSLPSIR